LQAVETGSEGAVAFVVLIPLFLSLAGRFLLAFEQLGRMILFARLVVGLGIHFLLFLQVLESV
jgi:hypothetical protein